MLYLVSLKCFFFQIICFLGEPPILLPREDLRVAGAIDTTPEHKLTKITELFNSSTTHKSKTPMNNNRGCKTNPPNPRISTNLTKKSNSD